MTKSGSDAAGRDGAVPEDREKEERMPAVSELFGEVAAAVRANADEFTELDRAIGDGDHGLNLRRGFDAVAGSARSSTPCRWARRCRRRA